MKTVFVWESASGLTSCWHDGGGAMVVAGDLQEARELLKKHGVKEDSSVFSEEPGYKAQVMDDKDHVFIFPDAGCC
jgi:hypothetical protein